jgi:hypothetical protein
MTLEFLADGTLELNIPSMNGFSMVGYKFTTVSSLLAFCEQKGIKIYTNDIRFYHEL